MRRAHLRHEVISQTDLTNNTNIVASQAVSIYEKDGTTPLAQTIYNAATGGSTVAYNAVTADVRGFIDVYANFPQPVVIKIGGVPYPSEFALDSETAAGPVLNVGALGVAGDGVTNDRTAIQAVVDLATNKEVIYFPKATYLLNTTVTLASAQAGVTLLFEQGAKFKINDSTEAFTINATDVLAIGGEFTCKTTATGEAQEAFKVNAARFTGRDAYGHDLGGPVYHCGGADYPLIEGMRADNTGIASNSAAGGSFVGGGAYLNICAYPIVRGGIVTNSPGSAVTVSSCTNAVVEGIQGIGASGDDGMENGVYELGSSVGTKILGCTLKNTIFELIQLGGVGFATVIGNTLGNDAVTSASVVGIHCGQSAAGGGSDHTTISGNTINATYLEHTLIVGRSGVSVDGVLFANNIVSGPGSGTTAIEASSDTKALMIHSNEFNGNVIIEAKAGVNTGTSIRNNLWQNVSLAGETILRIANARCSDNHFHNVTAGGIFERALTSARDVYACDFSLTGTNAITAIMYGDDASALGVPYTAGQADEWYFENFNFGDVALAINSGVIEPLKAGNDLVVNRPKRIGNSSKRFQHNDARSIANNGELVFGPFSGTANGNPVLLTVRIVGQSGVNVEEVTLVVVKGNNDPATLSYTAGVNNGSTVFTSGSFAVGGSGNQTVQITYTNSTGGAVTLSYEVLALMR